MKRPNVVAIGGGSGLATLLRGLKYYSANISAIVTMTDNGQSSGRLSRELGSLPPGDVRKCLAALASDETLLTKLFEYRFTSGRGLSGHSLGNLLLLALSDITGSFDSAVEASSNILSIKGRVIPSTFDHVHIMAELKNGQTALGEKDIPVLGHRFGIKRINLVPDEAAANPQAITALKEADLILVGPGSLYTSIIPNFLIKEIAQEFERSSARKYFICNVSTERGETERYSIEDHIRALRECVNGTRFDGAIVNNKVVRSATEEGRLGAVRNITTDQPEVLGMPVVLADLINDHEPLYHDSAKLSQTVWQVLIQEPSAVGHSISSR